jgi:hypothetical protein
MTTWEAQPTVALPHVLKGQEIKPPLGRAMMKTPQQGSRGGKPAPSKPVPTPMPSMPMGGKKMPVGAPAKGKQ